MQRNLGLYVILMAILLYNGAGLTGAGSYLPTSGSANEGHDPHFQMKMRVITRDDVFLIKHSEY